MKLKKLKSYLSSFRILFLLIFISAAVFRLTNLDLIEFKADEAINLFLASRPLFGHHFPPGSTVSSIGLLNPPLFNYLLFPIVVISTDPKIVSFFIALINSLAICFFFQCISKVFGKQEALLSSILISFSPWAIIFSRKIWSQNLIIPLTTVLIFSLSKIIKEKNKKYWILYSFINLLIIQLHQSAIFFLTMLNFFLFIQFRKNKNIFHPLFISFGIILGLIPLIPYLIYLIKNLPSDPRAFLVAKERFAPVFHPQLFLRPLQITNQGNFYFLLGKDTFTFKNLYPFIYNLRVIFYIEYLLIPFGAIIFWKKYPQWRFLVTAVFALPFIYFFLHFEPLIHYFLIIALFLFIFLGCGISWLINSTQKFLKLTGKIIFLILIIISIIYNSSFFKLLRIRQGFRGDYGIAYSVSAAEIQEKLLPYKNDPHYKEMFLASFLPTQYWYGYLPIPRMIYNYEKTKNNLKKLEARLKEVPVDSRVQLELLAFWTQNPPTKELLSLLKEKTLLIPGYLLIYREVIKISTD
jgi:hypothetical protein